jgi:hypothetical protein
MAADLLTLLKKYLKIRRIGSLAFPDAFQGAIIHGGIR